MTRVEQKNKTLHMDSTKIRDILPTIESRRFIRHPLNIPLACKVLKKTVSNAEKNITAKTANVSLGGLLFAAKNPFKIGALLMMKMPFEDRTFSVKSKVVHCTRSLEAKIYNVGVSFYQINDAFKAKLVEQIYRIAEYRDLRSMQIGKEMSLEEASKEWISKYAERFNKLYW